MFFEDNSVNSNTTEVIADGGAIAVKNNGSSRSATFSIRNSSFLRNTTTDEAGAILIEGHSEWRKSSTKNTTGDITNCTFVENEGTGANFLSNGGAVQIYGCATANITNSTFYKNAVGRGSTALTSSSGGAISSSGSNFLTLPTVNVKNNLFVDNYAQIESAANTSAGLTDEGGNVGLGKASDPADCMTIFGTATPVLADNNTAASIAGSSLSISGRTYQSPLQTLLIAPNVGIPTENYANDVVTTTAVSTPDQRGRTRGTAKQDAGSVEINWLRFEANGGEWIAQTQTTYNGDAYWVFDGTICETHFAVDTTDMSYVTTPSTPIYGTNTFIGWSETKYAVDAGTLADCVDPDTLEYANQTLYAVWHSPITDISITYDANSGVGGPYTDTVTPGSSYTILGNDDSNLQYTKNGYRFNSWNTGSDGAGTVHSIGSIYNATQNLTLYAQWLKLYDVVYENGLSVGETDASIAGIPANESAAAGDTYSIPDITPTRTGYNFQHWATTTVASTGETYPPKSSFTMPAQTVTLTAVWKKKGGSSGGGGVSPSAELIKVDAADSTKLLTGATFELYKKSTNSSGTDILIGTYTTSSKGQIQVSNLSAGNYYWIEKSAPTDYQLDRSQHDFTLGSSGKKTVTVTNTRTEVPEDLNGDDHYAYMVGYEDKTVRPQNNISRAEVATIFFRLLEDSARDSHMTQNNSFTDVSSAQWFNTAVSTMSSLSVVKGYPDGDFHPNDTITRAEFAAIAARFDTTSTATTSSFTDIHGHWASSEIAIAAANGWVQGYEDDAFRPNQPITRAEAVTLIHRVLKRNPESPSDLLADMVHWSDNSNTSAWYYLAIQEATNSHYYKRKENQSEFWIRLRENRDWTVEFETESHL